MTTCAKYPTGNKALWEGHSVFSSPNYYTRSVVTNYRGHRMQSISLKQDIVSTEINKKHFGIQDAV